MTSPRAPPSSGVFCGRSQSRLEVDMADEDRDEFEDHFNKFAQGETPSEDDAEKPDEDSEEHTEEAEETAEGAEEKDKADEGEEQEDPSSGKEGEQQEETAEQKLERLERERDDFRQRWLADNGRVRAYQQRYEDARAQLEQRGSEQRGSEGSEGNPSNEQVQEAAKSPEAWQQLKDEYPGFADAVEAYVSNRLGDVDRRVDEKVAPIQQRLEPLQEQAHSAHLREQYAALEAAHPDYQDVATSDAFQEWVAQQPGKLREMAESWDAAEVSRVLSIYKAESGARQQETDDPNSQIRQQRQDRLQRSASPPSRGSRKTSDAPDPDDFDANFEYFARKQQADQ